MQSSQIPSKFQIPFANGAGSGYIRQIPVASQISVTPGAASLTDGFPPLTFLPEANGGIPPFGQDMNGILNEITAWIRWGNAGAPVVYDATFSAAIGGYPKGAILTSAAGGSWWLSTAENNLSNPDTGGAGWLYLSYGLTYAGNPNGNVAGVAATTGALSSSMLWDTAHSLLWVCTTTGTDTTAVWTSSAPQSQSFWCGTSTGTGNAQIISGPIITFAVGTAVSWRVGASQSNTGAAAVTVNSFGPYPLVVDTPSGPQPLSGGELIAGNIVSGTFDGTSVHLEARTLPGLNWSGAAITPGHLAVFQSANGSIIDGGPANVSITGIAVNTSQVVGPGTYFVDTSGGPITLTLTGVLTGVYTFVDAQNTWSMNNLTIGGNGWNIGNNSTNVAPTFLADVSDYEFSIEASSTYWRLV